MEPTKSYKGKSDAVRRRARSHLVQLRQARLAKRGDAEAGRCHVAVAARETVDTVEPEAAIGAAVPAPEACTEEMSAPEADAPEAPVVPEAGAMDPVLEDSVDGTPDLATAPEAAAEPEEPTADLAECADEAPAEDPQAAGNAPAPEDVQAAAEDSPAPAWAPAEAPAPREESPVPADSDLFALPGAGSGLVWMLQNAGIRTLDDLAGADADKLTGELGLIGQILNVRDWIVFAQDRR